MKKTFRIELSVSVGDDGVTVVFNECDFLRGMREAIEEMAQARSYEILGDVLEKQEAEKAARAAKVKKADQKVTIKPSQDDGKPKRTPLVGPFHIDTQGRPLCGAVTSAPLVFRGSVSKGRYCWNYSFGGEVFFVESPQVCETCLRAKMGDKNFTHAKNWVRRQKEKLAMEKLMGQKDNYYHISNGGHNRLPLCGAMAPRAEFVDGFNKDGAPVKSSGDVEAVVPDGAVCLSCLRAWKTLTSGALYSAEKDLSN